ncbi:MAG TPA: transglycosylase family protein [Solirubrobacterales bacterium]|nr:transglycosylase family protein [Solirubrobacterales bacterium]
MLALASAACIVVALGVNLAGAEPSLKDQIDSAKSNAGQLSDRVTAQTTRIVSLTEQAHQAGAQAMVVAAQVERTQARARELAAELRAAEAKLDRLRAEYAAAVKQLEQRLVAIYESDTPDEVTVLLNANGFDDLATRSAYLDALHDADRRVAAQVASLRDQVAEHVHQVAELKQQADAEAQQLSAERANLEASQEAANQAATAVATARAQTEASLSNARGQVADLEKQLAEQQASAGAGNPAYLGGPYAIPTYIVMCESGGNYHALNSSSGAGGAYQILPSTWRAYGGQGAPQDAPKAEQDRIAAMIWRDSGPSAWACA